MPSGGSILTIDVGCGYRAAASAAMLTCSGAKRSSGAAWTTVAQAGPSCRRSPSGRDCCPSPISHRARRRGRGLPRIHALFTDAISPLISSRRAPRCASLTSRRARMILGRNGPLGAGGSHRPSSETRVPHGSETDLLERPAFCSAEEEMCGVSDTLAFLPSCSMVLMSGRVIRVPALPPGGGCRLRLRSAAGTAGSRRHGLVKTRS